MTTPRPALRSQRLNQITHEPHGKLDALVKAHAPFETQASYARFVVAQYLFQSELVALYNDAQLAALIPDLPARCRAEAAKADLADLDTEVPAPVTGAVKNPSQAEALGWLFVSEGSKLGAAFLIKRAVALGMNETFGARHLAEPAGGRAEGWKTFTRTLDDLAFTEQQEAEADRGALEAFNRFTVLLEHAYAAELA
jgi:heme oxygenase